MQWKEEEDEEDENIVLMNWAGGLSGTLKDGSGCEQAVGRLPSWRDGDGSSVKR